jgi:Mrp family chromosome partitioning ATPase/capsular polysaccharide biosynthesis protein
MIHEFNNTRAQEDQETGSGRAIDLKGALLRYWKTGLCIFLAVIFLGVPGAWLRGKPNYRAEGVIYISPRNLRNLDSDQEQDLQSNSQFREFMQQQAHTINRYDIVLPIVQGNAPGAVYFRSKGENERRAADRLRGTLKIASVPDTYQMTVALEGDTPKGLAEVVNAVMENYVQVARKEMFYDSDSRLKNLYDERDRTQNEISQAIEQRNGIAEKLGTTLFNGGVINNYEKQAGSNLDALMDARRQRFTAESSLGAREGNDAVQDGIEATASVEAQHNSALTSYRAALISRRAELLMRIQGLAPKHAGRIAAEKDIATIDAELERATSEAKKMAANNLRNMQRGKLAQSSDLEKKLTREAAGIQAKANEYMRNYQRAIEVGEELERLRKRLNATEDRISTLQLEVKAPGYVRIFSPAMTPDIPIKGGRKRLLEIVMAAALLLGVAVPIGIDFLDPRVRSARELEAVLGLPVTGWLPRIQGALPGSEELLRLAVIVRRHLTELSSGALVISAMNHGSGSSTISLGMAKAMDSLGVHTLVIEMNSKTPDPRYLLGERHPGFAQWMAGDASLRECVNPATAELPARICTGEGARELALMAGDMARLLIEEARKEYDLVLIDAAPVAGSLLTEELIREIDAVMLVSQARTDNRKDIKAAMKTIENLRPRTFGSVLNKVA